MNQDSKNNPEIQNSKSEAGSLGFEFVRDDPSAEQQSELMEWLAQHPEESARLHELQDLVRLYQQSGPPQPSELLWNDLAASVMAKLSAFSQGISRPGAETVIPKINFYQRWLRSGILGTAAAAAIVLALVLGQGKNPNAGPAGPIPGAPPQLEGQNRDDLIALAGDLSIIDPNDVDLVSMEGNDYSLLVVGNPPVSEALVLVRAGDVAVGKTDPDVKFHMPSDPDSSPMIVVPIRSQELKDPDSK